MLQLAVQGKHIPPLPVGSLGVSDPAIIEHATARVSPHPVMTFLQPSKALAQRPDILHTCVLAGAYANVSPTFRQFHRMFEEDRRAQALVLNTGHVMMMTDAAGTLEVLKNAR